MFAPDQYQLIDFGDGRKLERFGEYVLDRPSPSADRFVRTNPSAWRTAHARYERTTRQDGEWIGDERLPDSWTITHEIGSFELSTTPFGHVGVFPEQAENWPWIAKQVQRAKRRLKVLNLFAYTGGSTIAAASAGAEVVHVDSARNMVERARRNAARSGLADAPIRWITEDAVKFVRRELRRGNRYQAVILDPPSYGHGPKGEAWKIGEHLMPLLKACGDLTKDELAFLLVTCHSPGYGPAELEACLAESIFGHCRSGATAKPMTIRSPDGRKLPSGVVARWPKL